MRLCSWHPASGTGVREGTVTDENGPKDPGAKDTVANPAMPRRVSFPEPYVGLEAQTETWIRRGARKLRIEYSTPFTVVAIDFDSDGSWVCVHADEHGTGQRLQIAKHELLRDGQKIRGVARLVAGASNGPSAWIDPAPEPHGLDGHIPRGSRSPAPCEPLDVLQVQEDFAGGANPTAYFARFLKEVFVANHATLQPGEVWYAWAGQVSYHPQGLIFWVGVSSSVPAGVLTELADEIHMMGFRTGRVTVSQGRHDLSPLLYLGEDGVERLSSY